MSKIGVREVAKLANVSIGTVDRALNNRVGISDGTRKRVLAIAERVGYKPDLAARALSAGRVPIQIGVCIPKEIRYYFSHLLSGILAEARRFKRLGIQVIYRPTPRLGVDVAARISEFLDLGVKALLITPGDPQEIVSAINAAEKKDIRVVCVDTDAPASDRSSVVCTNTDVAGKLAAELMSSFVPPRSNVAIITGMLAVESHARIARSFCELYSQASAGGKIHKVIEAHEDEEECFQKCYSLLQENRSLAGLYVSTVNCLPVCRAICAHGLSGKIVLITSDLFKAMTPYFEKGTIRASIHGRPFTQGEVAMRMVIDHVVNHRPLRRTNFIPPQIVLRSNFHLFREIREVDPASPAML